jgi:uncharacterized protein (TIGR03437 family)
MTLIRPVMAGTLFVLASASAFAQTLTIISGNGQLTCPNCTTNPSAGFNPLVVELRDPGGNPIPNETVTWQVTTPATSTFIQAQGLVNGATSTTTTTDASGRSQVSFQQGSPLGVVGITPYVQSQVIASARGLTVNFFETTSVADLATGVSQVSSPQLVSPLPGATLTGRTGEQSETPVQISVQSLTLGGVPGVEIRLVPTDENNPTTARCAPQAGAAPGTALTDITGVATCNVIFGGRPGSGSFVVRIGGNFAETAPIQFNVTLGLPQVIRISSGNGQSGNAGSNLFSPLTALVEDSGGNVLANVPVTWTVLSGGVTLFNSSSASDANGRVSTNVRLGATPGLAQIRVSAVANPNATATFSATTLLSVTGLQILSGNNQSAPANTAFAQQLVVQVSDQGQPLANIPVTFAVTSGSATLTTPTATSDAQGRAATGVTAGPTLGNVVVTASIGSLSQTFNLTVRQPGPSLQTSSFLNPIGSQRGDAALSPCGIGQIVAPGIAPGIQGTVLPTNLVGPLPVQLAGVSIQFGNSFAPIYHVAGVSGQELVTFQVPCDVQPGDVSVTVRVGQGSATITVPVRALSPGIFETLMSDGLRRAVLLRPDGTFVSIENPARRNEIIRMYVTGIGQGTPALGTNQLGIPNVESRAVNPVVVGVNNVGVRVESTTLARNLLGVWEVAFEIPSDTPAGANIPLAVAVQQGDQLVFGNGSAIPIQ